MSDILPTTTELVQNYYQYLQSNNPDINPTIDPIFNILGATYAGMLSGTYASTYVIGLNIFPQTATGVYLDRQLAEWGLPPRSAGTYALGNVQLQANATTNLIFLGSSVLTDSSGTLRYLIMATTSVATGTKGNIPIISANPTSGYAQTTDTLLNLQIPVPVPSSTPITQLQVISLNDGGNIETDAQVQTRLLNSIQIYLLGGTKSDYQNWCLQANPNVTGSSIVLTSQSNLSIYLLGGQLNINNVLSNPNGTYSRSITSSTVLTQVQNYINSKAPYTDIATVASCSTYIISELITITVNLNAGYTLNTLITNSALPIPTISVKNLICQEFRRAIILSAQIPQLIGTNYYITTDTLLTQLNASLSASPLGSGEYAQILLNVSLTLTDPKGIIVPNPNSGPNIIYDILNTPNPCNNVTVVSV